MVQVQASPQSRNQRQERAMFKKFAMAVSLSVSTALGSTAWAAQEQGTNEDIRNQRVSNPTVTTQPATGTQPTPTLASAMANFMVRTGLVVGTDSQGRLV